MRKLEKNQNRIRESPCMECADRETGCHGRCERYRAYQEIRTDALKQKRKYQEIAEAIYESMSRTNKSQRNRHGIDRRR